MVAGIESTYARDSYIDITCVMSDWIECAGIKGAYTGCICTGNAFVKSVKPRSLAGSGVTLADSRINNCCF